MNNYARNNQPDRCHNCHHIELHVVWEMQCAEKASDASNQATSLDDAVSQYQSHDSCTHSEAQGDDTCKASEGIHLR